MTEGNNTQQPASGQAGVQFSIQTIYLKDSSFEAPNSPQIFTKKWSPKTPELQFQKIITKLTDDLYDAVLKITATVKDAEDNTVFLIEVHQAGVFTIAGMDDERVNQMLNTFCMYILFPYARETVSSLVIRGGFQPLLLPPVDFDAMYMQQKERKKAAEQQNSVN